MSQTFVPHPGILPSGKIDSDAEAHSPTAGGSWRWEVRVNSQTWRGNFAFGCVTLRGCEEREGLLFSLNPSNFFSSSFLSVNFLLYNSLSYTSLFSFSSLVLSLLFTILSAFHYSYFLLPFSLHVSFFTIFFTFLSLSLILSFLFFTQARLLPCLAWPKYPPIDSVYNSTHRSPSLLLVCAREIHKGSERGNGHSGRMSTP